MKRWLIGIGIVVLLLGGLAWIFRDEVRFTIAMMVMKPSDGFDPAKSPPAPDYADDASWAALPTRSDGADRVAPGESDGQATASVDVFFIHPTTYLKSDGWNQPLGDVDANRFTDEQVLVGQASAFNACCRVFAPRYRQATFFSFLDNSGSGQKALELAYGDVERAFDEFLKRIGDRPFIVAGHSQGAGHALALLVQRITGTPLRERLVAAYAIGTASMTEAAFKAAAPDIPVCSGATQTGCVINWNSVGPEAAHYYDSSGNICVNPLTWATDGKPGDFALNLGSFSFSKGMRLEKGVADAACSGGQVVVSEIRSDMYAELPPILGHQNYHLIDYGLFYINIRRNAEARVAAYLAAHP